MIKHYILFAILFVANILKAQTTTFKVDCGNDTFFCIGLYPDTTFNIGSQLKLTNGVAPFKYSWSCKPIQVSPNLTFTAKDFLNDTSIANPYLVDFGVTNKPWCFYLTVSDYLNNTTSDSICITCSRFIYHTKEYDFYLNMGDSVQFYDDIFVDGGIPPVKYYWTPSAGLDDSTRINAWCKPLQTTYYYQYIIDSANCRSIPNPAYNIYINPNSIVPITGNHNNILNFKQVGRRLVFDNHFNRQAILSFYSMDGKKLYVGRTHNSFFDITYLLGNGMGNIVICVLSLNGLTATLKVY